MLVEARERMLAEARARKNRHTEVQARMLAKAHVQMLADTCARTFLLRLR